MRCTIGGHCSECCLPASDGPQSQTSLPWTAPKLPENFGSAQSSPIRLYYWHYKVGTSVSIDWGGTLSRNCYRKYTLAQGSPNNSPIVGESSSRLKFLDRGNDPGFQRISSASPNSFLLPALTSRNYVAGTGIGSGLKRSHDTNVPWCTPYSLNCIDHPPKYTNSTVSAWRQHENRECFSAFRR
jgi:hypothetical protein